MDIESNQIKSKQIKSRYAVFAAATTRAILYYD